MSMRPSISLDSLNRQPSPYHRRSYSHLEQNPTLSNLLSTLLKVIAATALIAVFYLPHNLPQLVIFSISSATLGIVVGTLF